MVSQKVSQNRQKEPFEYLFDTPPVAPKNELFRENLKERSDCLVSTDVPAQRLDPNTGNGDGLSVSRHLDDTVLITEYTTQPNSETVVGPAKQTRTRSSQSGSTAPTLILPKEVSGMPKTGNGSIFQATTPSGKTVWKVDITTGYDFRGKRKRVRKTAHSHSEAVRLQRQMLVELEQGTLGVKRRETVFEYSQWWLKNVKTLRVRPSTLTDYQDRLVRNVYPFVGDRKLAEITSRDIEELLSHLAGLGKARLTINGAKQVFGAVLSHAYKSGIIPRNPAEIVSRLPAKVNEPTRVKDPWSKEEAELALLLSKGTKLDLFVHLSVLYGLRRGEVLGLKWTDFNFLESSIAIQRTLKEYRELDENGKGKITLVTDPPKTRSGTRKLMLTPVTLAALQRHREYVENLRLAARQNWVETEYVFVSNAGTAVYPSNVSKQFKEFLKKSSIRHIRGHDMRHTAAVLGLGAGVRLEAVSQGLGHSRIDITKNVYAPYVQPLVDEFTTGLADYLMPNTPDELLETNYLPTNTNTKLEITRSKQ